MPVALSMKLGQLIVAEKRKGKALTQIANQYHLFYTTVCRLYRRYKIEGKETNRLLAWSAP